MCAKLDKQLRGTLFKLRNRKLALVLLYKIQWHHRYTMIIELLGKQLFHCELILDTPLAISGYRSASFLNDFLTFYTLLRQLYLCE